jgi:hypothetical protein
MQRGHSLALLIALRSLTLQLEMFRKKWFGPIVWNKMVLDYWVFDEGINFKNLLSIQ